MTINPRSRRTIYQVARFGSSKISSVRLFVCVTFFFIQHRPVVFKAKILGQKLTEANERRKDQAGQKSIKNEKSNRYR